MNGVVRHPIASLLSCNTAATDVYETSIFSPFFSAHKYEYTPIAEDEIRPLYIQPEGNQEIQTQLLSHKQTVDIAYKALSYCWATDLEAFKISVQGVAVYLRCNLFEEKK